VLLSWSSQSKISTGRLPIATRPPTVLREDRPLRRRSDSRATILNAVFFQIDTTYRALGPASASVEVRRFRVADTPRVGGSRFSGAHRRGAILERGPPCDLAFALRGPDLTLHRIYPGHAPSKAAKFVAVLTIMSAIASSTPFGWQFQPSCEPGGGSPTRASSATYNSTRGERAPSSATFLGAPGVPLCPAPGRRPPRPTIEREPERQVGCRRKLNINRR